MEDSTTYLESPPVRMRPETIPVRAADQRGERQDRSCRMVGGTRPPADLNKHEQRTRETRELLLQAAETVFVRDGYESADLAEIAQLAGRTKGAIYAQFKSKEELFLALIKVHALRRREIMRELRSESTSIEDNLAALRQFCMSLSKDDVFGLLLLEFKLYTIRHPDARKRLGELYESLVPEDEEAAYRELLGPPGSGSSAISRATSVHATFAMLYALQVEMRFSPQLFDEAAITKVSAKIFDALFEVRGEG